MLLDAPDVQVATQGGPQAAGTRHHQVEGEDQRLPGPGSHPGGGRQTNKEPHEILAWAEAILGDLYSMLTAIGTIFAYRPT